LSYKRIRGYLPGDGFKVRADAVTFTVPGEGWVGRYVRKVFQGASDFGASSVNYPGKEPWSRGGKPK